jgi:beta-glucosidase
MILHFLTGKILSALQTSISTIINVVHHIAMKNILLSFIMLLFICSAVAQKNNIYHKNWIDLNKNGVKDIYEDSSQPVEKRVVNLLSFMTVDEKTNQMVTLYGYDRVLKDDLPTADWKNAIWKDGIANIDEHINGQTHRPKMANAFPYSKHALAVNTTQKWFIEETRLGIPVDFTNEAIHGLCHERATPLPAPIGIGSTWNKRLVYQAGSIAAREAKLLGYTNLYAPILDPARDQRWGRIVETYGEDPFLIAELGKQMTLGIQDQGIAATLKHFAVYSVPKGARDGYSRVDPQVSPRTLHEIHLYPFRRVIQEAKPLGIMSSYNDWDGVPITGSYYFLTQLLRQQYGFNGYVVSDSEALEYLFSKHHVAATMEDAVKQSIEAGLNVRTNFTKPETFLLPLRKNIAEGKISMKVIDARVADVLRVKFKLGLFDHPYVKDPSAADKLVHTAADEAFAQQICRESMVLLKNESNLLPLDKSKLKNILVTGPLSTATKYTTSRYGPSSNPITTVLDGIKKYVGSQIAVEYAKGCDVVDANWPESEIIPTPLTDEEQKDINEAVDKAKKADVIIAVMGEDDGQVGEAKSRTSLDLPGRQFALLQALKATGKPIVMVMINGRPLTINWENKYIPAILEAWFPGPSSGDIIAKTLFGEYNPGGKLTVTFPKSIGQIETNFPFKPAANAGQPLNGNNGYGKTLVVGPLYPFGYGLSYTTFGYSNLTVTPQQLNSGKDIDVTVDVQNTGQLAGDEVVQLYIKDKVSSVTTYVTQLRGFERISLSPNEKKTVKFTLHPADLEILDKNMNWTVEPGEFQVLIGSSSEDIRLTKDFQINP